MKAGQVILALDNIQQSAALDAALSEARKNILNAERYEYLYKQVPSQRRNAIGTPLKPSKPATKAARCRRAGLQICEGAHRWCHRGPGSVKLGDYVKTGQTITGIVDNSTPWTLMEIPASEASAVKVGQT